MEQSFANENVINGNNQVLPSFENLMDDDSIVNDELFLLASSIRCEVINVLDFFLSFLKAMIRGFNP
jgi:hypothetical protein